MAALLVVHVDLVGGACGGVCLSFFDGMEFYEASSWT